jgi:hypothetical protein
VDHVSTAELVEKTAIIPLLFPSISMNPLVLSFVLANYRPERHSLCTCCTTSNLMGAVKTAGKAREPDASPASLKTLTVGRAAISMGSLLKRGCLFAVGRGT